MPKLAVLAICACASFTGCGDDAPTTPSQVPMPGAPATLTNLRITGPTSVPPGSTAQYIAVAEYSDGSSKDVTEMSDWSPGIDATWFPIYFPSRGLAVTTNRGERKIFARHAGKAAMLDVLVLESGTFRLTGVVSNTSGEFLSNLHAGTVEVLSGTGTGLKAAIGDRGVFDRGVFNLYGVAGPVRLRAAAAGFGEQIRDVIVTSNDGTERFPLSPTESAADVSGEWLMTVSPSPECRTRLPDIARDRSYQVRLTARGTNLEARISSPTLRVGDSNELSAPGIVVGSRVRLVISGDTDEGEWTSPTLHDQLSPTETFGFSGFAEGTVTGSEAQGTLDGDLVYWDTVVPNIFVPQWYCRAKGHILTLRR